MALSTGPRMTANAASSNTDSTNSIAAGNSIAAADLLAISPLGAVITIPGGNQAYDAQPGDTVIAGSGLDTIAAIKGGVSAEGGTGSLTFLNGLASSTVTGGAGSTTVLGGPGGGDFTGGAAGHNVLVAQGGNTTLHGAGLGDLLFGANSGNTSLVAGTGLSAGSVPERLVGGAGNTSISGGTDAGVAIFTAGATTVEGGTAGHDSIVGGQGFLTADLQNGDAVFGGSGITSVNSSTVGADTIIAGSGDLSVTGRGSNMLVSFGIAAGDINTGNGASLIFTGPGPTGGTSVGLYTVTITEGAGPGQVELGGANALVSEAGGAMVHDVVKGAAGGKDSILNFKPGSDTIHLFGYSASDLTIAPAGPSFPSTTTALKFSDGTQILLAGITDPGNSIVFG